MRIYDAVDEGLGHSSYLIEIGDGAAALVDPPRFPSDHEARASHLGLRIAWTFDTHSHADYVTGSPALAARLGATFVAPAASRLETPHRAVIDGDAVDLGRGVRVVAMATLGHTPDHHAYLLYEHRQVVALFSGGSLMVGAVGRTDLCGPDLAELLAHDMFRSLRRFDDLPDGLAVYPTHGAGSFCSAPGSSQRITTLGDERATNALFAIGDEDRFVERLLAGFGTFPNYFARLPELNRLGPRRYDTVPDLAPLGPDDVDRHLATGGVLSMSAPPRPTPHVTCLGRWRTRCVPCSPAGSAGSSSRTERSRSWSTTTRTGSSWCASASTSATNASSASSSAASTPGPRPVDPPPPSISSSRRAWPVVWSTSAKPTSTRPDTYRAPSTSSSDPSPPPPFPLAR